MPLPRGLYGIIDSSASPQRGHREITVSLLAAGVRALQLRAKDLSLEEIHGLVTELLPLIHQAQARLLVNDHVEVARSFEDVGVHLGQADGDPRLAREALGPRALIGCSTHNLDQVQFAQELPIDYLGFGPVFSSAGKHRTAGDQRQAMEAVGTDLLSRAVYRSSLPIVAIGGINEENLSQVLETGVHSVAVISAITKSDDPCAAALRIRKCMEKGSG
ncbi:MAG: thiamine phosphate synthase [Myxococcota bacterium]|nr:thiamine phosphate synthase [Myxococcota bacterium]